MKKIIFIIGIFMLFTSSSRLTSINPVKVQSKEIKKASSILFLTNVTPSTTITSVTITIFIPWGNQTFTSYTPILPNGEQTFNLGNTTENVEIDLTLSNSISGSLEDCLDSPYNCPWFYCNTFASTNNPAAAFYFYGPNFLYLTNTMTCLC